MPVFTEGRHAAEFIMHEQENNFCREAIAIAASQDIDPGEVLGRVAATGVVVSKTDVPGAGKGVLTLASPAFGSTVKPGEYKVVFVEPAANAGTFVVEDPDGIAVGGGNVAVAYDGPVKFTVADGSTDFVAGDVAKVLVTVADMDDAFQYKVLDPAATDGTQIAAALPIYAAVTGAGETKKIAGLVRGPAIVNGKTLTWPSAITDAQKAAAIEQLADLGILVR